MESFASSMLARELGVADHRGFASTTTEISTPLVTAGRYRRL